VTLAFKRHGFSRAAKMPLKRMGDRGERLPNLVSGYDFSRAAVNPDSRKAGFSSTRPLTSFAVYSEGEPDRHAKDPALIRDAIVEERLSMAALARAEDPSEL
jgi:hypothetical protein